jgi:osmotically inducible protein OsmC
VAEQHAQTTWEGDLSSGSGTVSLDSGTEHRVSWRARAEEPGGGQTSPEELIAGALSACFSMALSGSLAKAGTPPRKLDTDAVTTFEKVGDGFRMTRIALTVRGDVDAEADALRAAAETAKENCPVSQALKGNVDVSVDASLA